MYNLTDREECNIRVCSHALMKVPSLSHFLFSTSFSICSGQDNLLCVSLHTYIVSKPSKMKAVSGQFSPELPLNFLNGKRVECVDPGEVFQITEPATGNQHVSLGFNVIKFNERVNNAYRYFSVSY